MRHTHAVPIKHIVTGVGALNGLSDILAAFRNQNVFLMGDETTMALGRDAVLPYFIETGCMCRSTPFPARRASIWSRMNR